MRPFTATAFYDTMRFIWGLAMDFEPQEVNDNLFLFKLFCLGDWKKVTQQGPWLFRRMIHKIPELYRILALVDQLARRIGRMQSVELNPIKAYEGDYVRVRASIDVGNPLIRVVPLAIGKERMLLDIKYEKMGMFCEICGLLGHTRDECGTGINDESAVQYGKWMLAKRRAAPTSLSFLARAPFFGRRGGGRSQGGRGRGMGAKKRSLDDADLDKEEDLTDTASSPAKTDMPVEPVGSESARKKLDMGVDADETRNPDNTMSVEIPASSETKGVQDVPPPPPHYVKPKANKKIRQGSPPSKAQSSIDGSAASVEGDRREQ
ncbi:hypothetical protein BRADI_1g51346v3 [Brachypodium distachyon]|uniref:Zinc knuckle CX2CX4HX4C domain-containing protein n=1 Tax=Brachypodium distachyon TaxID=15368 RepID=A0A2K2DQX4_BRADI|nr:hypothetical protein BRADI_1g51346v3 [Brachypodium distachyon]